MSGRQRGSAPDIRHDWLSVEVKDRRQVPLWIVDAMGQAIASIRGDQVPIVVLHEAGRAHSDDLVFVRLSDWCDLMGKLHDKP